ncbi:hypothetical protein [Bacillus sp. AK031]
MFIGVFQFNDGFGRFIGGFEAFIGDNHRFIGGKWTFIGEPTNSDTFLTAAFPEELLPRQLKPLTS